MSVKPTTQVRLACDVLGINHRQLSSSDLGSDYSLYGLFQETKILATFETIRIKGRWYCRYLGQWYCR